MKTKRTSGLKIQNTEIYVYIYIVERSTGDNRLVALFVVSPFRKQISIFVDTGNVTCKVILPFASVLESHSELLLST